MGNAMFVSPTWQPFFGIEAARIYANGDIDGPVEIDPGLDGRVESHYVAIDEFGRGAVLWERKVPDDPQGQMDVFHLELR